VVPLRVGVLGPVTTWRDGQEALAGQPRQLAVLGMLATRANRVVSRGDLIDAVWGDDPPASAEGGIYTYVAGLRRVFEPDRPDRPPSDKSAPARSAPATSAPARSDKARRATSRVLVSTGGGYMLRLEPGAVDSEEFEQSLSRARALRTSGDLDAALSAVDAGLALWRGTAFAGVPGPFAEAERRRLDELRTAAAEERADLMLGLGRASEVIPGLTALIAEHPLRERARGLLMTGLYRCGRQAEALQVYYNVREKLGEDLGIDPGPELNQIHQQVLAMDPALDRPVLDRPALDRPGVEPMLDTAEAIATDAATGDTATGDTGTGDTATAVTPTPEPEGTEPGTPVLDAPALDARALAAGKPAAPRPLTPAPLARVPAQVPPDIAGFAGRTPELRTLHAMVPANPELSPLNPDAPASPSVAVITGTAGVGKTALAIRFARQAASHFPDGQLYVNLRGFDQSGNPANAGTVLRSFFEALSVPSHQVPPDVDGKTALFRSLLNGKRMLLLLDNARSTEQVRPLLPGSPGCVVVITSRSQLTGLVAAEGARLLQLDVLSGTEARELLAGRLGEERVAAEPAAAGELILRSSALPLALSVTCARAAARPGLALADLASELRDARSRLDVLQTDDVTTDLRAVFSWSYNRLSDSAKRMFRLLGVQPSPDVSAPAAASLAGIPLWEARATLAELTSASLLTEESSGRFTCHDLLRAYAAERAAASDDSQVGGERDKARLRLIDHYARTAYSGALRLFPGVCRTDLPPEVPGVVPLDFATYDEALTWFTAEHHALHSVITLAAEQRHDDYCWKLAWHWSLHLKRKTLLHEAIVVLRTGLTAAKRLGDADSLGRVHYELGHAYARLGKAAEANQHLARALEMYTKIGDRISIAQVHQGLVILYERQGVFDRALPHAQEALRLRRSFGDRAVVAYSENALGWVHANLGHHQEALVHCKRALGMHKESGNRSGTADALDSIAFAYAGLGEFREAMTYYGEAITMYRDYGDPDGESGSLMRLGDAQVAAGRFADARQSWQHALSLLTQVPGKDSRQVTNRLARLAAHEAASA
jgi:DNA-binding SARP family transcriptional activator/tetratricopeptide (TPR) repeat protein